MGTMTNYDFHDDVLVFDEYSQLVVFLLVISCFMIPLGGYVCFHDTTVYKNLQPIHQNLWTMMSRIGVFYILLLLICALTKAGYHTYSLRMQGTFPGSEMSVECLSLIHI